MRITQGFISSSTNFVIFLIVQDIFVGLSHVLSVQVVAIVLFSSDLAIIVVVTKSELLVDVDLVSSKPFFNMISCNAI